MMTGDQLQHCSQRPYTCEYCSEYKSTLEDEARIRSHWAECKSFLLPCPNNCTSSGLGIERQNLDHHVRKECPLTVVRCEFHSAGCEVTLPRRDMADHIKEDSIAHINLLIAENDHLARQLLKSEDQMISLTRQNTKLKNCNFQQAQELDGLKDQLDQLPTLDEIKDKVTSLEAELQLAQTEQLEIDQLETQHQLTLYVEMQQDLVPVAIKMAAFSELKKKGTVWYSRPFFTAVGGYKMCLEIYANGCYGGRCTHVSVFTCFMRGESDHLLKWPFRGKVAVQLANQLEDSNHLTDCIHYTNEKSDCSADRVTFVERSDIGWGMHRYIPHSKLGLSVTHNRQYLKDDCLIFRILSVKLK